MLLHKHISNFQENSRWINQFQGEENMKIDISKNNIVCGDNIDWLKNIPNNSIDLCYIDPPFFSNANYEKVWGNGWEVTSFADRFAGDILHYIEWMRPRIQAVWDTLKPTGSIFLHCDWHASHRLRCLLDDIFKENFRNEIIWSYTRYTAESNQLQNLHDIIFWYSKSDTWKFNTIWEPYGEKSGKKDSHYKQDENGKWYRLQKRANQEPYRIFLNENGKRSGDVWEIPIINASAKERIGYNTQKPEYLVKRIIECASDEGDIILDCFSGGFTTAKCCVDLNRIFICGDVSPVACKIGAKRLNMNFPDGPNNNPPLIYDIKGLPYTEEEFKNINGHDFAEMICDLMGWDCNKKKSGDKGIDGWDGNKNPIQIKNHSRPTGERDLRDFVGTLLQAKVKMGIFVAWEYSKNAREIVAKMIQDHKIQIELRTCRDLIGDLLINKEKRDEIETKYNERCPEEWKEEIQPAS